ncbi:flavin-containing monooxygenase [Amycolatopsis suaedae]|uniref:NAD(P)/FAD-dependent oxidoreductase n=1 Tax=Amycolatopsis suaedae TaxID=2510978 RepID=A0A4Q7IZJ6_9PSEU|nr:NAD(P)-binding domain-containing protein [Amycolatopsis suaedae]RZQ59526.1 NAD(P)/FAD-dependent oxidoreductase [Amycolatopsis suaedae]
MRQVIVVGAGQSGLAAARALLDRGLRPLVLEAGADTAGSWPHYYASLRLFTPAHFNTLPGLGFPGDPDRYPTRDEMADYLRAVAAGLDCEIRTGHRVSEVTRADGHYRVRTRHGAEFTAAAVVAATGSFGNPYRPRLAGLAGYTGTVVHASEYHDPAPYAGKRVVVVGAGNSAVQIAVELAEHARVSLASRAPIRYATTEPVPAGSRFWSVLSAAGRLPAGSLFGRGAIPVLDIGGYGTAIAAGRPDRRDLFVRADDDTLHWADGTAERVDVVILATGYRPALDYLRPLAEPRQRNGLSRRHPGLAFVGLEYQRTILSATVHGVGRDARHVARVLSRSVRCGRNGVA